MTLPPDTREGSRGESAPGVAERTRALVWVVIYAGAGLTLLLALSGSTRLYPLAPGVVLLTAGVALMARSAGRVASQPPEARERAIATMQRRQARSARAWLLVTTVFCGGWAVFEIVVIGDVRAGVFFGLWAVLLGISAWKAHLRASLATIDDARTRERMRRHANRRAEPIVFRAALALLVALVAGFVLNATLPVSAPALAWLDAPSSAASLAVVIGGSVLGLGLKGFERAALPVCSHCGRREPNAGGAGRCPRCARPVDLRVGQHERKVASPRTLIVGAILTGVGVLLYVPVFVGPRAAYRVFGDGALIARVASADDWTSQGAGWAELQRRAPLPEPARERMLDAVMSLAADADSVFSVSRLPGLDAWFAATLPASRHVNERVDEIVRVAIRRNDAPLLSDGFTYTLGPILFGAPPAAYPAPALARLTALAFDIAERQPGLGIVTGSSEWLIRRALDGALNTAGVARFRELLHRPSGGLFNLPETVAQSEDDRRRLADLGRGPSPAPVSP